jgi:hypothetical protein
MELLGRAWLLMALAALSAGCMVPSPLRNPRSLDAGAGAVRSGVGAHYAQADAVALSRTSRVGNYALEGSLIQSTGLGRGLEWDWGGRVLVPFDLGLLGALKWQWLGQGRPRGIASSLLLEGSTVAVFSGNDISAGSLWAIPIGKLDLVLGGKYGWRMGHPDDPENPEYNLTTNLLFWPRGDFWEIQLALQAQPGPGTRPYAGLSIRRDRVPAVAGFDFGPQFRLEFGLEMAVKKGPEE